MIETNACVRCSNPIVGSDATSEEVCLHGMYDVDGSGPYCGAACLDRARRGIPHGYDERLGGETR